MYVFVSVCLCVSWATMKEELILLERPVKPIIRDQSGTEFR